MAIDGGGEWRRVSVAIWGGVGRGSPGGEGGVVEPGDGLVNKCQFRREL